MTTLPARPLSGILACLVLLGCASHVPEPRVDPPPSIASAPAPQPGAVAYRLFIAPPEDERESVEGSLMTAEDLRAELHKDLSTMSIFEGVTFNELDQVDLVLRPVIVSDRIAGQEPNAVSELAIRFELLPAGSSAVIWSELYRETSPSDIVFQSPVPPGHQLLLAHRANRHRIIATLKTDLAKLLYVF
ncbi:MAG TPA: hypothetical protein VJW75_10345 [Candidatus Eisenbacteria bacterium]|nr:hypothetical protein [Candidatus Eisenbacteria bacterium]